MFRFLKDIFKKEEAPGRTLSPDEIPALLALKQEEMVLDLRVKTESDRRRIIDTRDHLLEYLGELASAEIEEAIHPKLEKVAKNSLPQFKKAMYSALQRPFSEDPEEFYHTAGDTLKGCVKSLAGQGRYLQGVFPDDMKPIRIAVNGLGRSVNAMTPFIAESRKIRDIITAVKTAYNTLIARCAEHASAESEIPNRVAKLESAHEQIREIQERLSGIKKEPEAESLFRAEQEQKICQEVEEQEERHLRSILSIIVHVYRKGEKISARSKAAESGKEIKNTIELMVSASPSSCEEVINCLKTTLPLITSMITSGDIQLKNREERDLFNDPASIPEKISHLCERVSESAHRHEEAVHACHHHPLNARIRALTEEQKKISRIIEEEESRIDELKSRCDLLSLEIPVLQKQIAGLLSTLEGQDISLDDQCTVP